MDQKALEKCAQGLESSHPLFGGWIRSRSLGRLARESGPLARLAIGTAVFAAAYGALYLRRRMR